MTRFYRLLASAALLALATGCGGGKGSTAGTTSESTSSSSPPTIGGGNPGASVSVTLASGYKYEISADPVVTATTEAASGLSPQNAPPSKLFLQATLRVKNATDRQEPLDAFATGDSVTLAAVMAIPLANAGTFGASCTAVSGTGSNLNGKDALIPPGYCILSTSVSSINGPNSDAIGTVEMNPGDSESVVIYSSQVDQGNLPLPDVAVFVGDQSPGGQVLGPASAATTTSSGAPIFSSSASQVLLFARSTVQTAADPTSPPGRVELTAHLTVTNPSPDPVDVSGVFSPGIQNAASTAVAFTVPMADLAAFGVDQTGSLTCGSANGAPTDDTCVIMTYFSPSASHTIAGGASETVEIDGRAEGVGFSASLPVQDIKLYYVSAVVGGLATEIPQKG